MEKIGIIGAGNMGMAIALRLNNKGVLISDIALSKVHLKKVKGISVAREGNVDLVKRSDTIVIAVKPQDIACVLNEISPFVKNKLIISIAAGVTTEYIENILGKARVIRVMPNMPAIVGKGISAITLGRSAQEKDIRMARRIFLSLGEVIEVSEDFMDAVTSISGSGPAYYFLLTDILEKAAIKLGLKKALARQLAFSTFIGAAEVAKTSQLSMSGLVKKVASKGGTTEAALKVFKRKGLKRIVREAVRAAAKRSGQLSKL